MSDHLSRLTTAASKSSEMTVARCCSNRRVPADSLLRMRTGTWRERKLQIAVAACLRAGSYLCANVDVATEQHVRILQLPLHLGPLVLHLLVEPRELSSLRPPQSSKRLIAKLAEASCEPNTKTFSPANPGSVCAPPSHRSPPVVG